MLELVAWARTASLSEDHKVFRGEQHAVAASDRRKADPPDELEQGYTLQLQPVGDLLGVGGGQAMLTDIGPRAGAERPLSGLLVAGAASGTRGDLRMIWLAVDAILFAVINQCSVRRH